ncbi:MAG: Maf family protein [Candidatus Eremiobacteraeota bacterium]|nr:Maf family protein [Candidatus Eremiobacteraeota bacterium]
MIALEHVVLASASPRRLELLRSLRLEVTVAPSAYVERELPDISAKDLAIAHARGKALEARTGAPASSFIIASDTVVDVDGQAYGKPIDRDGAAQMLRTLSGRTHLVHTAFALVIPRRDGLVEECSTSAVTFYALDEDEIARYVASGEPMDKAGAYGIQGYGATLVERIDGDFYTVMGFPLARFARGVKRLGFSLPIEK